MFTLAHFTDPHIGPLPEPSWQELVGKRLSGYLSWTKNRHRIHSMDILSALTNDIMAQKPDHIALTSDIINISLRADYRMAAAWMNTVAPPDLMSVIPGNHDAYVHMPFMEGLGLWQDYMSSDETAARFLNLGKYRFPWLRLFGKIALIGLSSAIPTWPFIAGGQVGERQLKTLSEALDKLGAEGFFRIILIHHPPLPGQNSRRKGLRDAEDLKEVLLAHGAELVQHGHNHKHMIRMLESPGGPIVIAGAPSASARKSGNRPSAGYFLFDIEQCDGSWHCGARIRNLNSDFSGFEDGGELFAPLVYS